MKVLKRWVAMDRALARGDLSMKDGLVIAEFARRWRVSERTIRRDREAFGKLGQKMDTGVVLNTNGRKVPLYYYADGVRPLFTANDNAPPG